MSDERKERVAEAEARAGSWWEAAKTYYRLLRGSDQLVAYVHRRANAAQRCVSELEEDLAHAIDTQHESDEEYYALAAFADTWRDDAARWEQRAKDVAWAWSPGLAAYEELLAEWAADDRRHLGDGPNMGDNDKHPAQEA